MRSREIIYEFQRIGNVVKATAIDVETGIEASTTAPASATELSLKHAAARKLSYVLRRQGVVVEDEPGPGGNSSIIV
jgi:hypothetical protein